MRIFALASIQSTVFWALLFLVSLIVFAAGLYFIYNNRRLFEKKNVALLAAAQNISELDRCDIANLESVQKALNLHEFELLNSAAERIVDDAARIYQGKWISDPHKLFTLDNLLTRSEYTSLSVEIPIQLFTLSMLGSALFWIAGFSLFDASNSTVQHLAALPLILGLLLSLLLFFSGQRQRGELTRSMNYLAETISRRLPIFEELAGTAVLIDSFVQYDREMAESVSELSDIVRGLAKTELADRIADNVKEVMERDIAPSIKSSSEKLALLTDELQTRQEKGMGELAGIFTQQLGAKLNHELTPLFLETDHLVEELHNSSSSIEASMEALRQAREESYSVQEQTARSLSLLGEARKQWDEDMQKSNAALQTLSEESRKLGEHYSGQSSALGEKLDMLADRLEQSREASVEQMKLFSDTLRDHGRDLRESLDSRNEKLAQKLEEHNLALIDGMKTQGQSFAEELHKYSENFGEKLSLIMENFEEKLREGAYAAAGEIKSLVVHLQNNNKELTRLLEQLGEGSSAMVGDIRRLSLEMNRNAERLDQQSNEIEESLKELNHVLENSVERFASDMLKGVGDTLDAFEKSLSEVSLRLSSSTNELSDSAARIARSMSRANWEESRLSKEFDVSEMSVEAPEAD